LPQDEQTLLVLRVDRGFSWRELAMVMLEDAQGVPDADIDREAVRLRQQFKRVKEHLKTMAEEEGVLGESRR